MLVIGLTGGIGSGKSTVAKLFAERGITVIDTDHLARDITLSDTTAVEKIITEFGPNILHPDKSLNRSALRKIIFSNEEKRRWLEKLLHPLIRIQIRQQVEKALSPYCIVIIPLLLETEPNPLINRILVVDAPEKEQVKRTQKRDNITRDEVAAIMSTQTTRAHRLASAHDVIQNNGSLTDLAIQVDRLHGFYLALAAKETMNNL